MTKEQITSSANPAVKALRKLQDKKGRQESGCFYVEGLKLVGDALENGADFLCVGMFDFQVEANVKLAQTLLTDRAIQNRNRAWMA